MIAFSANSKLRLADSVCNALAANDPSNKDVYFGLWNCDKKTYEQSDGTFEFHSTIDSKITFRFKVSEIKHGSMEKYKARLDATDGDGSA